MNKKAEKFKAMLEENNITAFTSEELTDDFNSVVFRSNLEIKGQYLPLLTILDDSIYGMLRVFVATKVVTDDRKDAIAAFLNEYNKKFKVFKYYISDEGDIVLDCCLVSNEQDFDPNAVRAIIEVVLKHLQDTYADTMKSVWGGAK